MCSFVAAVGEGEICEQLGFLFLTHKLFQNLRLVVLNVRNVVSKEKEMFKSSMCDGATILSPVNFYVK